jgi:hypothetical protein
VCVVDHSYGSSLQQRSGEEDIQALLEFKRRPLEKPNFTHYGLYCPLLISRPLALVLELSSPVSHTCDGRGAHHPSTTTALLAKRLRDCDSEVYEAMHMLMQQEPIAKTPHCDGDGFCLAAPSAVSRDAP